MSQIRQKIRALLAEEQKQAQESQRKILEKVNQARAELKRQGIGVDGNWTLAPNGKNVLIEGNSKGQFFIPDSFEQAHIAAKMLRDENGATYVEVFDTREEHGIEFLRVKRDWLGIRRAQSVLTDENGIVLSTVEAQKVRESVLRKRVEEDTCVDVAPASQLENTSVHVNVSDGFLSETSWVFPYPEEKSRARFVDEHRFLEAEKSSLHRQFERIQENSEGPRKDPVEIARLEALAAEQKLLEKQADIAAVAAGVKVAPKTEPVVEPEKEAPTRVLSPRELRAQMRKSLKNRPKNPLAPKIAKLKDKRRELGREIRRLNKEIRALKEKRLDSEMFWDENVGDWISPLDPRIADLERQHGDVCIEVRWVNEDLRELQK